MWFNHTPRYLYTTMGYGAVSKLYTVYDATVQRDFKTEPMLIRDKAFLVGFNTFLSVRLWPVLLFTDLGKMELSLRNAYKKPMYDSWIDYLFPC
jgi:hypothetical protein